MDEEQTAYFDSGSTTRIDSKVLEAMQPYFKQDYGNPASAHKKGRKAKRAMNKARETIAKSINAQTKEIIFTSGGTESNNLAIKGAAYANKEKGKHMITTRIEHKSVLNPIKWLVKGQGYTVTYLEVDSQGFVNPEELEKAITDETILVSIIHGNNEVGTIQNMEEIGQVTRRKNVLLHTDACQSFTKTPIDVEKQKIDLLTINSHKINGPKGVGAIYIKEGTKITPLNHGGGHEKNIRSGTPNIHGIVGFAKATEQANKPEHVEKMRKMRDKIIEETLKIPNSKLNGPTGEKRLPNNINIYFKGVEGEALSGYLERKGVYTSTGSACSSKKLEPSHVLTAMGMDPERANSSIRITLSRLTTEKEVEHMLEILPKVLENLRKISPLY